MKSKTIRSIIKIFSNALGDQFLPVAKEVTIEHLMALEQSDLARINSEMENRDTLKNSIQSLLNAVMDKVTISMNENKNKVQILRQMTDQVTHDLTTTSNS